MDGIKHKRKKNGFTILFAVLIASLVMTIGLSIFNITFKEFLLSSQIRNSQFAFYAADAGMECAIYWDQKHPDENASIFGGISELDMLGYNLIAYWRFNNSADHPTATDSSANNNNGTLQNMQVVDWVDARIGKGLSFDGVSKHVDVGSVINDLDMSKGTFSAWVKFNNSALLNDGKAYGLLEVGSNENACGGACPDGNFIGIRKVTSNQILFRYIVGVSLVQAVITNADIQDMTNWTHIAGVWKTDGTVSIYKNGVFKQSVSRTGDIDSANLDSARLAARADNGPASLFFPGQIDEVRIYDRALSINEIKALALDTSLFNDPLGSDAGASNDYNCNGENITWPSSGWKGTGWTQNIVPSVAATTTFDLQFDNGYCAEVTVAKTANVATIDSRGYNTCVTGDPRRVERALRLTY